MEQKNKSKKAIYRRDKNLLILFNTIVSIILVVCVFASAAFGVMAYITGDARHVEIAQTDEELGINTEETKHLPEEIVNIALFGLDTRDRNTTNRTEALSGRSDTMIVVSINTIDNTIKLTSILRDSWVPMKYRNDGNKTVMAKINAAYSYGGPQNAIHCLNSNFTLNIKDYVSVSMRQLWNVIDIMGGVDIEITEWERRKINDYGKREGFNVNYVESAGKVHLDGGQAMIYARIRNDSEEIRVLRQQKVLSALFEKLKTRPVSEYPGLLREILSNVETSLEFDEILAYAPMLAISDLHLQSTSVPGKEVVADGGIFSDTHGGWVWKYPITLEEAEAAKKSNGELPMYATKYIHEWIYGYYFKDKY